MNDLNLDLLLGNDKLSLSQKRSIRKFISYRIEKDTNGCSILYFKSPMDKNESSYYLGIDMNWGFNKLDVYKHVMFNLLISRTRELPDGHLKNRAKAVVKENMINHSVNAALKINAQLLFKMLNEVVMLEKP